MTKVQEVQYGKQPKSATPVVVYGKQPATAGRTETTPQNAPQNGTATSGVVPDYAGGDPTPPVDD